MDFGLGLVLSFTDNASAGIDSAVQSLNGLTEIASSASSSLSSLADTALLSATANSASMVGNSLTNMGSKFTSLFTSLTAKAKSLGSEYETFGNTLTALGGDYQRDIQKLFDFSTKSSLEVGEVKEFMFTLQSQGINAFDSIKGSISGTRQEMLAWLTDLRSSRMDVPAERFKLAIQNYIGSGESKMMRTVFDMGDIEDIIGRKAGATAEKRMQDIVDMVEEKGLTGLADKLSNTWEGVASNIDDAFARIFYAVANDGAVFEKLKASFVSLADVIIKLPAEDLEALGRTIGDAINTIIDPLTRATKGVTKFLKQLINVAKTNPLMLKTGIILTTIAGGVMLLSGVALKAVGGIANLCLVLKMLQTSTGSISILLTSGIKSILVSIAPLATLLGGLYVIMRTDFGGIRTMVSDFTSHLHSCFVYANESLNGSCIDMINGINRLRDADNFWGNITFGLMQIEGAFKFCAESWNNYTLSEDSFQKAKALGILPLIEAVLDLKYRFELFRKGFISGWKTMSKIIQSEIQKITSAINSTPLDGLTDRVTSFLEIFSSTDADKWYTFGDSFAKFSVKAISFGIALTVLSKVGKIFSTILTFAKPLFSLILSNPIVAVVGLLIGAFVLLYNKVEPFRDLVNSTISTIEKSVSKVSKLLERNIMDKLDNLRSSLSGIQEKFSGFTGNIGGSLKGFSDDVGILLSTFSNTTSIDDFADKVMSLADTGFDSSLTTPLVSGLIGVLPLIIQLYNSFKNFGKDAQSIFAELGQNSLPILGSAFDFIRGVLPTLISLVATIGSTVLGLLPTVLGLLSTISSIVSGVIVPTISKVVGIVLPFIQNLIGHVITLANNVLPIITNVISYVGTAISNLASVLIPIVNNIITAIMPIVSTIFGIISNVVGRLVPIVTSIITIIVNIIKSVIAIASPILTVIAQVAQILVQVLAPVFNVIVKAIGVAIDVILGIVQVVMSVISSVTSIITGIIQVVMSIVNIILQVIMTGLSFITGAITIAVQIVSGVFYAILSIVGSVWDGIVTTFSNAVEFFSDIFQSVFEVLSNIFNNIAQTFTDIWDGIVSSFNTIGDIIGDSIKKAINTVISGAVGIVNGFFKGINSCIGAINNIPGVSISKLDLLQVPQFAEGGVVNKPTLGIFGEAGQEAVVPLQNNTEWTSKVASLLAGALNVQSDPVMGQLVSVLSQMVGFIAQSVRGGTKDITPVSVGSDSVGVGTSVTNISNTDSRSNSTVRSENIDASVHFEAGAIVINANNVSELDAEKFAIKLMNIIKRKQELKEMLNYS